jgi:hypothetical protein
MKDLFIWFYKGVTMPSFIYLDDSYLMFEIVGKVQSKLGCGGRLHLEWVPLKLIPLSRTYCLVNVPWSLLYT